MRTNFSILMVFSAFCIFIVLSFSRAYGEKIFRWTDDTGRRSYSNVSPPVGTKTFSVDTVSPSAANRSNPQQAFEDIGSAEKMPAETDSTCYDFFAAFLKQRITDRKKSIDHIEALLRKHPNDSALRKSLFRKKQYLFEDLTRLKSVGP